METTEFKKVKARIIKQATKVYLQGHWIQEAEACTTLEEFKKVISARLPWIIDNNISVPDGTYIYLWDNGKPMVEATFVDGKAHGLYREWHPNGDPLFEATYVDGKKHGPYKEWFSGVDLTIEATYVDGKLHGPYKEWFSDGEKRESTYVNGVKRKKKAK